MEKLLEYLKQKLTSIHPMSFHEFAPSSYFDPYTGRTVTVNYPYVVFEVSTLLGMVRDRDQHVLTIDIWDRLEDNPNDNTRIESLTNAIDNELKALRYVDDYQLLIFNRQARQPVTDPDELIRRRQLTYEIKRRSVIDE